MSKINKIQVDGVTYDIEDKSVPEWAKQIQKPSYKTSELENDSGFMTETDLEEKELNIKEYVDEQISNIETGGGITELPIASETTLGGVKIGDNLSIDENGVLSANGSIENIIYGNYDSEIIIGYLVENGVNIPVYRKIFKGEKVSGSNLVFDTTSLNIGKVLNMQGSTDRGTLVYPLMRYEASDNYTFAYYTPNDNKLVFTSGASGWCSNGSVTIILEYIKKVN